MALDAVFDAARREAAVLTAAQETVERVDDSFQVFSVDLVYGELTPAGMQAVLDKAVETLASEVRKSADIVFADLGSGEGVPPLVAALDGRFSVCMGVELVPRLHRTAVRLAHALQATSARNAAGTVTVLLQCSSFLEHQRLCRPSITAVPAAVAGSGPFAIAHTPYDYAAHSASPLATSCSLAGGVGAGDVPDTCGCSMTTASGSAHAAGTAASTSPAPAAGSRFPLQWVDADIVFVNGLCFDEETLLPLLRIACGLDADTGVHDAACPCAMRDTASAAVAMTTAAAPAGIVAHSCGLRAGALLAITTGDALEGGKMGAEVAALLATGKLLRVDGADVVAPASWGGTATVRFYRRSSIA